MKYTLLYLTTAIKMSDFYSTLEEVCMTPIHKGAGKGKNSLPEHQWKKHNGENYATRVFLYSTPMSQCRE